MQFDARLVAVGELDDNPGQDTIGAIEIIAAGLVAARLVDRHFTLLHYLPRDHVSSGDSAIWQVVWRAREPGGSARLGMPTWERVPKDLMSAADAVREVVESIDPYDETGIAERTDEVVDLIESEVLAESLDETLRQPSFAYLWEEIAEMTFGPGAGYQRDSGRVADVLGVGQARGDRWLVEANVDLSVDRPDSDISPDVVEIRGYAVTFEVFDDQFPRQTRDLRVVS